jgi:hypothetical protein
MRMPFQTSSLIVPVIAAVSLAATCGCTTRMQSFPGQSQDRLWTAMVATARTPSYDDWKVMDNQILADTEQKRIEVYRVLKRTVSHSESKPSVEERSWRFQIAMTEERDESGSANSPSIQFTARQIAVPSHVWTEADRYFNQVRRFLEAPPDPTSSVNAAPTR